HRGRRALCACHTPPASSTRLAQLRARRRHLRSVWGVSGDAHAKEIPAEYPTTPDERDHGRGREEHAERHQWSLERPTCSATLHQCDGKTDDQEKAGAKSGAQNDGENRTRGPKGRADDRHEGHVPEAHGVALEHDFAEPADDADRTRTHAG